MSTSWRRKLPALEPTMFTLDDFDANEWITVYRRRRKSLARASRPLSWPGQATGFASRRKINLNSGQKAHDHMGSPYRQVFCRRPSPELRSVQRSPLRDDFGSRAF
jgi:hypothetical protein